MGPLDMGVRIRIIIDHELNDACTGRMKRVWDAPVRLWPHSRRIFSADIVLIELGKEYRVSLSLIRPKKKKACAWSIGTVGEVQNTAMWLFTSCSGEVIDKVF